MIVGEVASVTLMENITSDIDLCKIQIDFDELYIFGKYNDLLNFLNKRVSYDVIPDMYNGHKITTVVNLAEIYKIQTLDKKEGIRLIPKDSEERPGCNFDSRALLFGDTKMDAVAYLSSITYGSSDKSEWADMSLVDKHSKVFSVRIFIRNATVEQGASVKKSLDAMVGCYVLMNITSTKYGFQTDAVNKLDLPVMCPPEVETAISIILSCSQDDEELMSYMKDFGFIDQLKSVIDIEPGYHLVRIASELSLINAVENVSNIYDFKLLRRAAITSRGYLLPSKTKFSRPLLNVTKVLKSKLGQDRELLLILDPTSEEAASPSKNVYMRIAQFAEYLLQERRGINEEIKDIIDIKSLRNVTGGLL